MNPVWRTIIVPFAGLLMVLASAAAIPADADEPAPSSWQVYFSPEGGCTQAIVDAIGSAQQQVLVQAYELTSPRIRSALIAASRRGVQIKAIFDPEALSESTSKVGDLSAAGIPVFIDSYHRPGIAHNKVMVIDSAIVITGSFNFTTAAESRNAENLLVVRDLPLASRYEHNFYAHLAHSPAIGAPAIAPKSTYRRHYYRHYRHSYLW